MASFGDFLAPFLTGLAGRRPGAFRDPNSEEEIRRRQQAEAAKQGFGSVEEMNTYQAALREEELAKMRRGAASEEADLRSTALENESKDAELFARSGLGQGETATRFKFKGQPLGGPGIEKDTLSQLGSDLDTVDILQEDRSAIVGRDLAKEREEEIEFERQKAEFDQEDDDRQYQLEVEKQNLAKTREERIQKFTDLNMEVLREQIQNFRDKRSGKIQITPGQAMNIAQTILVNNGEIEEAASSGGAAGQVARLGRQIMDAFQNPGTARNMIHVDAVQQSIDRALGDARDRGVVPEGFEDEKIFETEFGTALQNEAAAQGEEDPVDGPDQGPEAIAPGLPPADDGIGDMRALDPDVSIQELLGLDPEQTARQQMKEIDEDNQRFEIEARFNIQNGIPREEWSPALLSWVEALNSGGNGLQAVQ